MVQLPPIPEYFACPRLPEADVAHVERFLADWHKRYRITHAPLQHTVSRYLEYCSPRGASAVGLEANAAYLAWFFAVNDLPSNDAKLNVQAAVRAILHGADAGDQPLQRSTAGFMEIARALGIELAGSTLLRRLDAMFDAFDWEVHQYGTTPTVDAYVAQRRHTVAVYPYLELWRVALGAEVPLSLSGPVEHLEDVSVDLTFLVNDILSTTRDSSEKKLNLLFAIMKERGCTRSDALEVAMSSLDRAVADYRASVADVGTAPQMHAALRTYIDFLGSIAEGTRVSMLALRSRYGSKDRV